MSHIDASGLRGMVLCARAAGLDVATIVQRHGFSLETFDGRAPATMVPLPQTAAIVRELLMGAEPGWVLRGARALEPGAMGILDHLCGAAPTVGACLADFARYFALVAYRGTVELRGGVLTVAFDVEVPQIEQMFTETVLGLVWSRLRIYLGEPRAHPQRLELRCALDDARLREWDLTVGCEVVGSQPVNRMLIPSHVIDAPLRGSNVALREFLGDLAARSMPEPDESWAGRVTNVLSGAHPDVDLIEVARLLAVSERTLRRRLSEEDTSFSELRQRELQRRAEAMLSSGRWSLAEIAFSLGFSEMSGFNRAFKRWTGHSPGRWRQHVH